MFSPLSIRHKNVEKPLGGSLQIAFLIQTLYGFMAPSGLPKQVYACV